MKTQTQFILVAFATAIISTGSAVAGDPKLQAIDNHHGTYIYSARPAGVMPTIALGGHAETEGGETVTAKRTLSNLNEPKRSLRVVATPHGTVSYFAPAA
jgi:hypothetical protein